MKSTSRSEGIGAVLALALLLLGLGTFDPAARPVSPPSSESSFLEATGRIPEPGVYEFHRETVNAGDLFLRAKGRPAELDGAPEWMGHVLSSGTRVCFGGTPSKPEIHQESMSAFHLMTLGMAVPLNRVPPEDLTALPGVGPRLACAIAAYRRSKGGIGEADDLLKVPGIGPGTLDRLRPYVALP